MPDAWDQSHRELVGKTLKLKSKDELDLLEHLSISKNLDPLAGELLLFQGRTAITTINGATKLCADELDGIDVEYYNQDGESFPVWLPDEPPVACAVSVWRVGRTRPFTASCRFRDYKSPGPTWTKMPSTMIRKCALAAALRLGFADKLGALYTGDEMGGAGMSDPSEPAERIAESRAPQPLPEKPQPLTKTATDGTTNPAVVEVARESEPAGMQPQSFQMKSIQTLYDRCADMGMTPLGWKTLCNQLNAKNGADLAPDVAQQISTKLTVQKIMLLNSGKPTTAAVAA